MAIELGISHFTCDCGAMICPPGTISTKGHTHHKEIMNFPTAPDKIHNGILMTMDLFDEIHNGDHDDNPDLVRFKGKTYGACISTLRAEYNEWRDNEMIAIIAKAYDMETSLKANAKIVVRNDTADTITIDAERFEAVIEGDDTEGRAVCPVCNKELCSWKT